MVTAKILKHQLQSAIDRSMQWATHGWPVTFGSREGMVSSLYEAENLSSNVIYRQVAVDYWNNVAQIGQEAAAWGRIALDRLANNNVKAVEDAVYYASYLERPFANHTMTWEPVHELCRTFHMSRS